MENIIWILYKNLYGKSTNVFFHWKTWWSNRTHHLESLMQKYILKINHCPKMKNLFMFYHANLLTSIRTKLVFQLLKNSSRGWWISIEHEQDFHLFSFLTNLLGPIRSLWSSIHYITKRAYLLWKRRATIRRAWSVSTNLGCIVLSVITLDHGKFFSNWFVDDISCSKRYYHASILIQMEWNHRVNLDQWRKSFIQRIKSS